LRLFPEFEELEDGLLPYRLWTWLAFARIPGNAFSFWVRRSLRWSRGLPDLPDEPKENLFAYLDDPGPAAGLLPAVANARARAEERERELRERYDLDRLQACSTAGLYRKNLYLLDILERAAQGLDLSPSGGRLKAMDVGAQDWHYVFALERWLARGGGAHRQVDLRGVELDGHGIYPDLRARCDYARAYAAQTGNPGVAYEVVDFLEVAGSGLDIITWFYPFVARHHLLLWGLPLRHFAPARLIEKAAGMLRPGGWLVVLAHTGAEQEAFLALGNSRRDLELMRAGEARSPLVDFHAAVADRRFSLWRRAG
jgi:hypothetical protein